MVQQLILIVHVLMAITIVGLVLLQHGKGADMGAAFGSGSAGSLFGSSGAGNFLSRSTAICATIFFLTSASLTYFSAPRQQGGVMQGLKSEQKAAETPKVDTVVPAPAKGDESKSKDIPK